jgi:hypothetical protein
MTGSHYILHDGRQGVEIGRRGAARVARIVHGRWPFPSMETQEYVPTELDRIDHEEGAE